MIHKQKLTLAGFFIKEILEMTDKQFNDFIEGMKVFRSFTLQEKCKK